MNAAIPPPMTKPATAAPIRTCCWCSRICLRQSVSSATSLRSRSTACAELDAVGLDRRADLLRAALLRRLSIGAFWASLDRLADPLRLLDRHLRRRRRAALDELVGDQPGDGREQEEHARRDQEAQIESSSGRPARASRRTRRRVQEVDERRDDEDPGGGADRRALGQLGALVGTSALASSISSRTSSEARSETSWTAAGRCCVRLRLRSATCDALEDAGEDEAAGEGAGHEQLRTLSATSDARGLPTGGGGPARTRRRLGSAAAGASRRRGQRRRRRQAQRRDGSSARGVGLTPVLGRPSSPSRLRRTGLTPADPRRRYGGTPRRRRAWSATRRERADAGQQPGPHEALDHVVVVIVRRSQAHGAAGCVKPAADRVDDEPLGLLEVLVALGEQSKIQPVSTCSIAP